VVFVLKKCTFFLLTLLLILTPSVALALELGAEAQSEIEVDLSLENESKLTGNIQAEGNITESGQYNLLYAVDITNQSSSTLDEVDVLVNVPAEVMISSYSIAGAEIEIDEVEEGLILSLPQIEGEGNLNFQLEAFIEMEQEFDVITSPVSIQIANEEVFLAELIISLTNATEETTDDGTTSNGGESKEEQPADNENESDEGTPNEENGSEEQQDQNAQDESTQNEAAQGEQDKEQVKELPTTGSAIGSWFWIVLGLAFIGSGFYLYRKSNVTIA
jgi:LPXTG-motif cell wall-anchored protein